MPKSPWLAKEWFHLRIRTWLILLAGFIVGSVIWGIFFVKREIVKYRPEHSFGVRSPEFFGSAHALCDPLPVDGNKVTLLQNGDEIFPAMLAAIAGANRSINFEAYIFHSDATGAKFRQALMEKARAGVTVRVLLDGLGSSRKLKNEEVEELKRAGCQFAYYHPTRSIRVDRINRRDHRRVIVVDGRLGFIGSAAFADQWSGHAQDPDHWRDLHAKVEGPVVAKLQAAFEQHWLHMTSMTLSGSDEWPSLEKVGPLRTQLTASHSYTIASIPLTQSIAIAAAEQRLWITNPYCTPTDDQIYLLVQAVKRGVDVRLLVPGEHNDQPMTKAAGRTKYGELLGGGIKIYEYQPTMIHQKTLVADSTFALLGSSNLDARSSQINEEIDLSVYDENFGQQMDQIFEKDLAQARQYTLEEFQKRGLWERFWEWVTQPFHSQL
jgi:cardiolipin synthase